MRDSGCDKILSNVIDLKGGQGYLLFELAQCFMSGYDLENLRGMLASENDGVVLDGLFVCKEIGCLVCQVKDSIVPLRSRQDPDIRKMAEEVEKICERYGSK